MAIADFAVRPLASPWFLQDSHIHSIRIELSGMEVEEPSGKWRGGNAAMDREPLIVAASNASGETICTNLPCKSQGEAACH